MEFAKASRPVWARKIGLIKALLTTKMDLHILRAGRLQVGGRDADTRLLLRPAVRSQTVARGTSIALLQSTSSKLEGQCRRRERKLDS